MHYMCRLGHLVCSNPTVKFETLTIVMSSERPFKNKPMRQIAKSLHEKLSSLLRLSRVPTPSLMDVDPRSDNDIATTNPGKR